GSQLPIGELAAATSATPLQVVSVNNPAVDSAIDENAAETIPGRALPPAPGQLPGKVRTKSGIKVPNFSDFRKKLIIIIAAGVLLIGFLVWALFFAPRATVQITARTSDSSVNNNVTLGDNLKTDLVANTLKTATQQTKKTASVEFEATGTKDVGEKATGQVVFRNCESETAQTIPSGTVLTANSITYVTQAAATVPAASGSFLSGCNPGISAATPISASAIGTESNVSNGTQFSVAGHTNSAGQYLRAVASTDVAGGSKRQAKVVSATDIQKATEQLKVQDIEAVKKELRTKLGKDVVVVDQSYKASDSGPVSTPALDQEVAAGVKPKLTSEVTYSLSGVDKNELNDYLDAHFAKQLEGIKDQRTYDNGADKVTFTNVNGIETGFTASIVATAQIGPKIEDSTIKESSKGKRYGEIQSSLEAIQGVDSVDVKFWPFWVNTAPNDVKKINVEFRLHESK
ncbi:MAG: hypothetical protein JWM07_194, partial [Candidatus Saccharibacteria bacterium]|nr:hypothetical protein [Candidatus Saccharibacteria bacterium]